MKYQRFLAILLAIGIFFCILFSVTYNLPALALTQTISNPITKVSTVLNSDSDIQTAVDHYLNSLPKGYYTVGNVEELQRLLREDNMLLVDVREPSEYATGHIGNAINIPLPKLTQNLDKIPQNQPVVVYCTSGYRSAMAVMSLRLLGYENVRGFPPSINGWKAAGQTLNTSSS
ncbi:Rhodanese-related sulfurtransferase [Nostoc sp. PCC 7524]|uniref:rhodanese-like domain-containing protein n=1 Tax=Nostoc sp. (strain ATCC 29411 / PCC 7524) TaxID=28072 RepID=UPI00029F01DE|nr:rhodanese-like domain-containing protein [Nostoc sp. PCC 7524]AFY50786.1 Rhodanese-related sulfurtransferase [Nostoc sp. PCC 7524]